MINLSLRSLRHSIAAHIMMEFGYEKSFEKDYVTYDVERIADNVATIAVEEFKKEVLTCDIERELATLRQIIIDLRRIMEREGWRG